MQKTVTHTIVRVTDIRFVFRCILKRDKTLHLKMPNLTGIQEVIRLQVEHSACESSALRDQSGGG